MPNTTFTDGGITFSNLDSRLGTAPDSFSIEGTESQFGPFFSPPNYLTAGGASPGPGTSFGRFGSAKIALADGSKAIAAIVEIFYPPGGTPAENILALEALRDGRIVASDSITFISAGAGIEHRSLVIYGGIFDTLRLVASGSEEDGTVFIGIDNVRITPLPLCFGLPATIVSTPGNDTINGTPGDDVIAGLGGNDVIRGNRGNDRICGGSGDDILVGGPGNDRIDGGTGNDKIDGGAGTNTCVNGELVVRCR